MARSRERNAVEALASGVAHEINNPLAFVLANLSFALDQLQALADEVEDPARRDVFVEIREALLDAVQGGERVKGIVKTLTTYSEKAADVMEPVNLRVVLMAALDLTRRRIQQRARLITDLLDVGEIEGNAGQLLQVFVGLLLNSAQATPEGAAEANVVRVSLQELDGGALVTVSDTGEGITPELRDRIFEPFVSTRSVQNQSGLGLSMCHGVVTGHGGRIHVESEPGHGATFRVWLPRTQADSVEPVTSAGPPRGRVLVIDDEALVARAVARTLGKEHEVEFADGGREGLARLTATPGTYDVILCDLIMPDLSGMDLYRELLSQAPGEVSKIIFLTGGAGTPRVRSFLQTVGNQRLEKPFDPKTLRELIRSAVG